MKKFSSAILAIVMILSILPITIFAEDAVIPISECGGVISSGKTYSVSTAEEFLLFEKMNNNCDGATIILTNNITIHDGIFSVDENQKPLYNGMFVLPEPIDAIDVFKGTFDGQGYTISGLYVTGDKNELVGILGELDCGAYVCNINIKNSLFLGSGFAGSICGYASCEDTKIEKCYSDSVVIGGKSVGGIAGVFNDGHMTNCYFEGTVIFNNIKTSGKVGGIVGAGTGKFTACANVGDVYGFGNVGGFAGAFSGIAVACSNTGDVYADIEAGGFIGMMSDVLLEDCYTAGSVNSLYPGKFMATCNDVKYGDIAACYYLGQNEDVADAYGFWGHLDICRVSDITLRNNDKKILRFYSEDFVLDTGNENNGYIIHKNLQRRTVVPSITNIEYKNSFDTRNTFTVTVKGRPAMIQFIEPTDGTRTYDRNHKNVTIKSYDSNGNEVNSLDRTVVYEVWSIYSNMMTNVEIRTRAKYLSDSRYTWESETYNFPMILANPIVSMNLSSTSGKKGPVPATVIADDKTEKVMFKMPDNTTVTVASKATDENGNKIFTGKAWMNKDGFNEIRVLIYRNSVWRLAGTLEYRVE